LERSEFIKLLRKLKAEVEEDAAIEEAESADEDELPLSETAIEGSEQLAKLAKMEEGEEAEEAKQSAEMAKQMTAMAKQQKDTTFEVYKRAMAELNGPCMLYTDTPLLYNQRPLHP
jgi:hypothetical protein